MNEAKRKLVDRKNEIQEKISAYKVMQMSHELSDELKMDRAKLIVEMRKIDSEISQLKARCHELSNSSKDPFLTEFYKVCKENLSEYLFKEMFNITKNRLDFYEKIYIKPDE